MPFADYDSFQECRDANSDKDDPGAYCAAVHHQATGEWPSAKEYDSREAHLEACLTAAERLQLAPDEDLVESIREAGDWPTDEGDESSKGVVKRLTSWLTPGAGDE